MIYDKAHELAKALKESKEFKKYKELTLKVNKNEQYKKMVDDYRSKMMELQMDNLRTGEVNQEKLKKLQELEQLLLMNSELKDFLQAELAFSQIYADINKIISEAIEIGEEVL